MPVDVHLLTTISSFLDGMQTNHLQGKELEILHEDTYWRNISKTASYCMPSLLAKSSALSHTTKTLLFADVTKIFSSSAIQETAKYIAKIYRRRFPPKESTPKKNKTTKESTAIT